MSDLIERDETIRRIDKWYGDEHYTPAIISVIESMPSAERPQGEWEVSCKDSVCSVCGKDEAEFICGTEDWYGYGLSNCCPNCGARMKGADDEV